MFENKYVLAPTARQDLARLAAPLQAAVLEGMMRLTVAPVSLSRPSKFPYPLGWQLFQFKAQSSDGTRPHFTILFHYRADETTLEITGIGHGEL